jgi:uncharacterized protein
MLINLRSCALRAQLERVSLEITKRLPANIEPPCSLVCEFQVQAVDHYFLLTLKVEGDITIICQRCLHSFQHHYLNSSVLAVCQTDELAEQMLSQYETIVSKNNELDLVEIVSDELYLYSPELHPDISQCDHDVDKYIRVPKEPIL